MRLDLLPVQPKEETRSEGGKEIPIFKGATPNQINLAALPVQPEPIEIPEFKVPPEGMVPLSKEDQIRFEKESSVKLTELFTERLALDVYGKEGLKQLADTQRNVDFFMGRAPRIGLAFVAPIFSLAIEALDQGKSLLVSAIKDEQYSPFEQRMLSEFLPKETPTLVKVAANLTETVADVALIGGLMNLAKAGVLSSAIKEVGSKLEAAGYGTGKVDISRDALRKAIKGTPLEKAIKMFIKSKKFQAQAQPPQPGRTTSTIKTPLTGKEIQVIKPPMNIVPPAKAAGVAKVGELKPIPTVEGRVKTKLERLLKKAQLEMAAGQFDLGTLDALGKSPQAFVEEFEKTIYPNLSDVDQKKILKHLEFSTGAKIGDVGYIDKSGKEIRLKSISDVFEFASENLKSFDELEYLIEEGDTYLKPIKGFVLTMAKVGGLFEPSIAPAKEIVKAVPPVEVKAPVVKPAKAIKPPVFKEPDITTLITSQSRSAEILGVKGLVEPLERGKMKMDMERAVLENQMDKIINKLKSLKTIEPKKMATLINTNEEAPKNLGEKEKAVFDYFRALTRETLTRLNKNRELTGREPIKGIKAYFRHISKSTAKDIIAGRAPVPEGLKEWAAKHVPTKIFNSMELTRKLEDKLLQQFNDDLALVMKSMVRTALREIHMDTPLELFHEELASYQRDPKVLAKLTGEARVEYLARPEMPAALKEWVIDYVNIAILGGQTKVDKKFNNVVTNTAIGPFLNSVLADFGKQISERPLTDLIVSVSKLPLYGVLGPWNPKQLLRNKFQVVQNIALYGVQATFKGLLPTADFPELEKLKTDSLFLEAYSGIEDMPASLQGKIAKFTLAAFQWSAVSNVDQAMNAAYHWTTEMIEDPKMREYGWGAPERTYTEPKGFSYPIEKARKLKEMEYGAQTAQYGYLGFMMPEAFRYKWAAGLTRLNSWWMFHWSTFHREAATRAFFGHTGYDTSLGIPPSKRINYLKYLILGGLILNTMGYTRSYMFGTWPTGLPPVANLTLGFYQYFTNQGDSDWEERKRKEASDQIVNSLLTFLPGYLTVKDTAALLSGNRPWQEYFFYKKKGSFRKIELGGPTGIFAAGAAAITLSKKKKADVGFRPS